jgi:hypothetical protein
MLELRRPLSRVLDGPGLLVQRLSAKLDLRHLDTDQLMYAIAVTDPDYINYLDTGRPPRPETAPAEDEETRKP